MIQSVIKSEIGSFLEQEFTSEWVPPFNQPVTSSLDSESGCQLSTFLVAFGFLSIRSEESRFAPREDTGAPAPLSSRPKQTPSLRAQIQCRCVPGKRVRMGRCQETSCDLGTLTVLPVLPHQAFAGRGPDDRGHARLLGQVAWEPCPWSSTQSQGGS